MKKICLLLLLTGLLQTGFAQQYVINANITGFANGTKFYLTDTDADANIDSAIIQNNKFTLKGSLPAEPQNLWLTAQVGQKYYYVTLLIGNEKINIKGDTSSFPFNLSVTGSKNQDVHNQLIALTREGYKKRNELLKEYFALKGDSAEIRGKQIWKVIGKLDSADLVLRTNFVKSHLNTYEGLSSLYYLKENISKDSLQQIYNSLQPLYKKSKYAQRIATFIKVGNILKEGDMATDFEALDKNGQKHRLFDVKGKYVLLDFSTTYCGPCILSVPALKNLAKKRADNLAVISFSGDAGKATWMKGLSRDQPEWTSLWDGKGYYSETIIKYGINGYPTFVMINPQGKIISKFSGYDTDDKDGSLFEKKIDAIIAKK